MKKILSLTLVLFMMLTSIFTLAACGNDKPEEGKKNDPQNEQKKEDDKKKEEPDKTVPYYDDIAEDTADDIF